MLSIIPMQDRIIVKRVKEKEKTEGGLFIPTTAQEKPSEGDVVAVGKGKILENGVVLPLEIKIGDRVLFNEYEGTKIDVKGEEYLIMKEDTILGIIRN